jgi:DNA (cytosine-5)-methyltransferase 1
MSNLAKQANSSITNEWATPQWLFNYFNKEFEFTHDLACTEKNKKCDIGLTEEMCPNGSLAVDWHKLKGWLWINPPYSPLMPWIKKAQKEHQLGAKIVMLIPPQSPSKYWSEVLPSEMRFIIGRIPFINEQGIEVKGNTRDSAVYIYGPRSQEMPICSYLYRDKIRQ